MRHQRGRLFHDVQYNCYKKSKIFFIDGYGMHDDRRQFRVRVFIFSVRGIAFTKIDTVARLHAQNTAYFFVLGCNLRKLPLYPHERRNSYFLTWDWFSCFWKSDPRQFLRNFVLHFTSYLCWKGKKRFWLNTIHVLTSFSFPYSFCIIISRTGKKNHRTSLLRDPFFIPLRNE